MLQICSAVSGSSLASFPSSELHGLEGRQLKRLLAPQLRRSRFHPRLLREDGRELADGELVMGEGDEGWTLRLVFLEFWPSDLKEDLKLISACEEKDHKQLEELLKLPRNPNVCSGEGKTPLHAAAWAGSPECISLLLEAGCEKEPVFREGQTPLHLATVSGHLEVVHLLLQSGAEKDSPSEEGLTPVHLAAQENCVEVLRLLLEVRADCDRATVAWGFTPLHLASHEGHLDSVRLLLEAGADKGKAAKHGLTPVHVAAIQGNEAIAQLFHDFGANLEQQMSHTGARPLHVAAAVGELRMVQLLVQLGVRTDAVTDVGSNAAQLARSAGNLEVARFLQAQKPKKVNSKVPGPKKAIKGAKTRKADGKNTAKVANSRKKNRKRSQPSSKKAKPKVEAAPKRAQPKAKTGPKTIPKKRKV